MSITTLRNRVGVILWVLALAGVAGARQETGDDPGSSAAPPASEFAPANEDNEIGLTVRRIGVGDRARPGDWAGFQLEVSEVGSKSREIIVQVEIADADGDHAVMRRVVSTTQGQARSVWLYGWLPRGTFAGASYRFSVYEAIVRPSDEGKLGLGRYTAGRRLAVKVHPVSARTGIGPTESLIGVVGLATGGLDQYPACRDMRQGLCPTGQEITDLAAGLRPDDLPDCWQGLMPFEAMVWTGSGGDFDPSKLKDPQALAIKEWVKRGGHLVVIVPSVGQAWYGAGAGISPLADIMPVVEPRLMEGVDLNEYRRMLTTDRDVSLGTKKDAAVYRFDPVAGVGPYDAMTILTGPRGEPVVVRRLVGTGAVTIVGLDPARRDLSAKNALQAQVFWNRILGKRLPLLSQSELSAKQSGTGPSGKQQLPEYMADRPPLPFDEGIADRINKTASAIKGLLTAFVVFSAYWLLAGPVGFFVLKQRKRIQHSWVAFLAVSGVFTLVGWGGAKVLRLGSDADKHLTFVDHVYGQNNQRMRSWVELTLPKYGSQRVSVAAPPVDAAGTPSEWHNTITSWQPQGSGSGLGSFPDARAYTVDARFPDGADYPARATTRQIQIDYAGPVPLNWGMPRPVVADPESVPIGKEIWIEEFDRRRDDLPSSDRKWKIHGVLTHDLPGELRNVLIVVVLGEARYGRPPGDMLAVAYAKEERNPWRPHDPLDLEERLGDDKLATMDMEGALKTWRGTPGASTFGVPALQQRADKNSHHFMYGLAFYPMLTPPDPRPQHNSEFLIQRESAQCWDLGRWFTQPCIIIVGILGDKTDGAVECPVPISIDGASGESVRKQIKGTTVVRWVYPLAPRPPKLEPLVAAAGPGGDDPIDGAADDTPK